jgi:pSer/pThr/pTyr-binding forkhead associated (FHA) protein
MFVGHVRFTSISALTSEATNIIYRDIPCFYRGAGHASTVRATLSLPIDEAPRCSESIGGATDIEIDDPRVSVLHCAVAVIQNRIRLYDLESTSRTYVNDARLETAELEHWAEFRVGSSLLLVTILPKRHA